MSHLDFNKKGNLIDLVWIPIILLVISLSFVFGSEIFSDLNEDVANNQTLQSQEAKDIWNENYSIFNNLFNNIFLIVFIGINLAVMVSAFFIRSHPLFYFVALFIFVIVTIVATIFSNVYEEITGDLIFSSVAGNFTFINHVMTYLPYYVIVISVITAILLYGKSE